MNEDGCYSGDMERTLNIDGMEFMQMPRLRAGGSQEPIEVFKGEGIFLRIGSPRSIEHHLKTHRAMLESGFPVANILKVGKLDERIFFIEEGLGRSLLDIFTEDCKAGGNIQDEHFAVQMELTRRHLEAQSRTKQKERDVASFANGIHLGIVCDELPQQATAIRKRFENALVNTQDYPYVLSHGDFNAANILEKGVIDFEDALYAPIGFDPVSAIVTTELYPLEGDYESLSRYQFTDQQRDEFYKMCDGIFASLGIPPLSAVAVDFAFFRTIWLVARMHKWPKLQQYRYDTFIKRYLD